jgi:2-dehydropantoate 2-reductase
MSHIGNWPQVAVVGAGAVGGYFGGMLAYAGAPVTMIGRKPFVDAVKNSGLILDTAQFKSTVRVWASTELSAASGAELVLFCVKTTDNIATARELAPFLSPDATVLSLQNGVDNLEQIRAAANIEAVPGVVYVAASIVASGHVKHSARGDLIVGPTSARTSVLAEMFARANVPCRVSDNIEGELWTKLLWNCALNAISALGHARYGQIAGNEEARKLVAGVVGEILDVARAANILLPGVEDLRAGIAVAMKLATQLSAAFSSTAQDITRGKRTEIDSLNGYISRRGAELGVPTPLNQALFALVKLLESSSSP